MHVRRGACFHVVVRTTPPGVSQKHWKATVRNHPCSRRNRNPASHGPDLRIAGNLYCKGELHIEGQIEGDINSSSVSVGKGAQLTGSIEAENILIDGAVNGQIKAPTVTIAASARVTDDVIHQTLTVEEGAHLEGHFRRMGSGEQASGAAPLKSPRSSQYDVD